MQPYSKQIIPFMIFMFIFASRSQGQTNNQWINFTGDNNIVGSLALEDSILWAGTYGELVKINLNTGNKEFFNASNSGLSVNFIRSIFIDHNKNKWFATYDGGLVKYDGSNWTVFHKENSGLPDNSIHSVTEDRKGNIWIATYYGGVAKYDGQSFQVFTEKEIGDPMDELERISFDKNNTLWGLRAGAYPGILFKYDGSAWTVFDTRKLQTNFGSFRSLAVDTSNVIWLATDWGLVSFDGTDWKLHSRPGFENQKDPLTTLFIDKKNNIWTSSEHAIYTYDRNSWTVDSTTIINDSGYIHQILFNNDKIFAADWGQGLFIYDGKTWSKCDLNDTKFPSHYVWAIATDKNNNTWVESGSSLIKFDGLNFSIISEASLGIKDYGVYEINFDSHNNMWLTLSNSNKSALGRYDGNSLQIFDKDSTVSIPKFHKVVIDKNDEIWASSVSGLVKFNGKWTILDASNSGLPADGIWGIAVDSKNNKWIATGNSGLVKYDGSNWTVYNTSNSQIGSNNLYNVAVDNNDDVWIGNTKGLIQLHNLENGQMWTFVEPYQKDLFNYFRIMKFGKNNQLYIADYGISKLAWNNTFTRYDIFNSGIPNNNIQALSIDRNNNKWIGAEGGLTIFNESGITTSVDELGRKTAPKSYILMQNYPNPFNPSTTINYSIPKGSFVELKVFDMLGREVSTLVRKEQSAGEYKVQFDASSLPSGMYIYSIQAGEFRASKKLLLIK